MLQSHGIKLSTISVLFVGLSNAYYKKTQTHRRQISQIPDNSQQLPFPNYTYDKINNTANMTYIKNKEGITKDLCEKM